jgi:predicted metalloendopeptidase
MTTILGAQVPVVHGVQTADLDPSVSPCQDFFQYANGNWIKGNPIPADQASWGGFNEVKERNRLILKEILEESAGAEAPPGSLQQKVGDFYASGMDTRAIERAGLKPLKPALARIDAIRGGQDLAAALALARLEGGGPGFGFYVGQDDKLSTTTIAQFTQGGLGLPDRDYYTSQDPKSQAIRVKYLDHVARMFALMGEKPLLARAHAGMVLALETRLAGASMTRVELRDPNAVYHKMTLTELAGLAPAFDWARYCQTLGLREETILVRQPGFFREFSAMVQEVPLAQWQTYLRWQALSETASCLSGPLEREHFAFYGTTLNGIKEMSPRWKRVQDAADQCLGEALGRLYVERAFPREAKARALGLVANLRAALGDRIRNLDWMGPATRAAALDKLAALTVKIGYPDRWRDYSGLEVSRGAYADNILRARAFETRRELAKLGRPIDRGEWEMTPPTVNAYYNPLMNEIVFPAGILQPPFFDPEADDAVNYGAIGMVIGHEMTHGFDDQGRKYDAQGNLKDWWAPDDSQAFAARTGLVVQQFDALEALPGLRLNGQLTLGENIADLGGLRLAFAAFGKSLEGRPRPADLDGFTPEQRFFLGYAQAWRFHAREEMVRMRVMVDPHAPPRFRVNAPLANLPEFAQAFGCGEGTPMRNPAGARPAIW